MPDARSSRRVWEIDLIRLLTFTAVISVHSLAFTQQPSNTVAAGFMMLLQFGREVFFAITGFVLTFSAAGKTVRPLSFWRRRIPFVAVPYLVWSLIYFAVNESSQAQTGWSWSLLGHQLIYGGAEYHLYFLVVTLQLYVLFPLLLPFLRATARRAGLVLGVVGVANLTWLGLLQYGHFHGWIWSRAYELAPTYSIYVLAGGYAALHWERVHGYVVAHARRLLAIAAAAAAVALAVYAVQLASMAPRTANSVTQPAMLGSCVAAVLVLAVVAERWVAAGRRWQRAVVVGSEISFGVYLAHPLILTLLARHGLGNGQQVVPSPLATLLGLGGAIVGASLLALAARSTPFALPLIGRPAARSAGARWRSLPATLRRLPLLTRPFGGAAFGGAAFGDTAFGDTAFGEAPEAARLPVLAKSPGLSEVSASGNQPFTSKG